MPRAAGRSGVVTGWPVGGSHAVLSRWNGASWTDEGLPEEISARVGSTLLDLDGVPGTRAVLAVGDVACESTTGGCGLVLSRGIGWRASRREAG